MAPANLVKVFNLNLDLLGSSPDIGKDLKSVFPFSNQDMQVLIEGDGLAVNGCRPVFGGWWHGV